MQCQTPDGPHGPQCLEGFPLPQQTFPTFDKRPFYSQLCPFRMIEMHRSGRVTNFDGIGDLPQQLTPALLDFWDNGTPMDFYEHVRPLQYVMSLFRDTFWDFMRALVEMRPHLLSPLMRSFLNLQRPDHSQDVELFTIVPADFHYALLREAHEYQPCRPWTRDDFGELTDEMQRHLLPFPLTGPVQHEYDAVRHGLLGQLDRDTGRLVRQFVSVGHTVLQDEKEEQQQQQQSISKRRQG